MSVITIQLGQCGNEVGNSLFSLLLKDAMCLPQFTSSQSSENLQYKFDVLDTYFTTTKTGLQEAKAVLVDMEPKVIRRCKELARKSGFWSYPLKCEYIQQQGSGNNWALGYHGNGALACDQIIELCRLEVEKCDHFGGFLILMSLAGGTGSGLGARITNTLKDEFPEAVLVNHVIWPFSSGEVIVQNYNTILTLSHLQQSSDVIIGQQNENLQSICTKLLDIPKASFQDMNNVASHKLASVLQPSFKKSSVNSNVLHDLVQAVASHPAFKLVNVKTVPIICEKSMEYSVYVWSALLKRLRQMLITDSASDEGINWELKLPPKSSVVNDWYKHKNINKSISNLIILRGKGLHEATPDLLQTKELYSDIIPCRFASTLWTNSRCFNRYEKTGTLVSNSQTFNLPLDNCIDKAWKMFNAGAFVHQYERYGFTENDFIDSFSAVEQILKDYQSI